MSRFLKKFAAGMLCAAMCLVLASCTPKGQAYPVNIGGVEVMVGQTTVSAFLDAGYTIRALNEQGNMGNVDAQAQLNADSYYSNLYLAKNDVNLAYIEVTTDQAVSLGGGIIAKVLVDTAQGHLLDGVTFDGVALAELTPEVLAQHVEGCKTSEDGTTCTLEGKEYSVRAAFSGGQLVSMEMSCNFDVA